MGKLIVEAAAVLNEDNPEFFDELMKRGVDAVEPEMKKQKAKKMKEDCDCEGFYKTEYFDALNTIQKLREELHDNEESWKETCDILCDKETMEGIEKSMQQIREGRTIPLSELKDDALKDEGEKNGR